MEGGSRFLGCSADLRYFGGRGVFADSWVVGGCVVMEQKTGIRNADLGIVFIAPSPLHEVDEILKLDSREYIYC